MEIGDANVEFLETIHNLLYAAEMTKNGLDLMVQGGEYHLIPEEMLQAGYQATSTVMGIMIEAMRELVETNMEFADKIDDLTKKIPH